MFPRTFRKENRTEILQKIKNYGLSYNGRKLPREPRKGKA